MLAFDSTALEDAAFGDLELIEASREQSLQRGRNDHLAVPVAGHRQHLLDEERVAAPRRGDLRAELAWDAFRDELLDVFVGQWLEPERHRPGGAASAELRPRHAEQQDRFADDRRATCSIRSRNVSSPHWMSSKTTRSGRSAEACFQRLADGPGDLLRGCCCWVSPSSDRMAAAAVLVRGVPRSCLSTSTTAST
jgi:hypothetical protein